MKSPTLIAFGTLLILGAGFVPVQAATPAAAVVAQNGPIRKGKIRVAAPPPTATTPAATEQAQRPLVEAAPVGNVYTGTIRCDLGADVVIAADAEHEGFFHVTAGAHRYHMHSVASRTGAVRLEDADAGATWLQLGNKSMLLDQKVGRRVADGCVAPAQARIAAQMQSEPQPDLLHLGQ